MPILPLPSNLPGQESAADKAIALKVNEAVSAINTAETRDTAHTTALAALETTVASLTTRIAALEQTGEQEPPPPPPPPVPVATISLALSPSAVTVGGTSTVTATTKDISGNTLSGRAVSVTV